MIGAIYTVQVDMKQDLAAGMESLVGQVNNDFSFTAAAWVVSAEMGALPTGQAAILDLQRSRDHGLTWHSIYPPGGQISIAPGGAAYGQVTAFAIVGAHAGDWMRCVCLQAGSGIAGKGVQISLHGVEGTFVEGAATAEASAVVGPTAADAGNAAYMFSW